MEMHAAAARFAFLADALHGSGGFRPLVTWENQTVATTDQAGNVVNATRRIPKVAGPNYLIPYQRESAERFAARCAVATYDNHLAEACGRFVGYLGRRRPMRTETQAPLVKLFLEDATLTGDSLDDFLVAVALHLRARGSMLVVLEQPQGKAAPVSLADQINRRQVPYARMIEPEAVTAFDMDAETGLFRSLSCTRFADVDGQLKLCVCTWDATGWEIKLGERVVDSGTHSFGQCPVLAVTETGAPFPVVGKYAQIADMSLRLFNMRSELDELLRGQTFSVLAMQVPPNSNYDFNAAAATLGVHSMLVYPGIAPDFIAPDPGSAETYLKSIDSLQQAIKRVAMDEATTEGGAAESGVARRLRFERLNASLATFSKQMQSLERRLWALFTRAISREKAPHTEWPTDFNLVDTPAEIDVLEGMQRAGFPPVALALKRKAIAAAEFDANEEEDKQAVLLAIDEQAQEPPAPAPDPLPPPSIQRKHPPHEKLDLLE